MLLSCHDVGHISANGPAHGGAASGVPSSIHHRSFPNTVPPPRMPELPASQWQSFSPTTTMKALCRALIETCKFAGESQMPSIHHRFVVSLAYLHGYDHRRYLTVPILQVLYMMSIHP